MQSIVVKKYLFDFITSNFILNFAFKKGELVLNAFVKMVDIVSLIDNMGKTELNFPSNRIKFRKLSL